MNRHMFGPLFAVFLAVSAMPTLGQFINPRPSRQFGHARLQTSLTNGNPNYLEGRELFAPRALAFDTSVSPPILYVADTGNNRVLAWRNPAGLQSGAMADRVIGQLDFNSTTANGPGTNFSRGFRAPIGVAVDAGGNLYVADSQNNRILRFRRPLDTQGDLFPDLVIGQISTSIGNQPNRGLADPTAQTLAFSRDGVLHVGMAFDSAGNLWVTDGGNNRVLRYPVSQLAPNTQQPAADQVIGQLNFVSDNPPDGLGPPQQNQTQVFGPQALAFDDQGGLYVTDRYSRALYFTAANRTSAQRILGIRPVPPQGQQPLPYPNDFTLGDGSTGGYPIGVFTLGGVPYICDTFQHRIVRYNTPAEWAAGTPTQFSPQQAAVYGQDGSFTGDPNRGGFSSTANSFFAPIAGAFLPSGGGLWVVDSSNNRVLRFTPDPFNLGDATVVLGQLGFQYNAPNLIEGRDLYLNGGGVGLSYTRGSSIAIDKTSTPNRLYVSDPFNHRILGFRDARTVGSDLRSVLDHSKKADIVIGQQDLASNTINFPGGDPVLPTDTGLFAPTGLTVAPNGDLFVADTGNGRVVRYSRPFDQPQGTLQRANLVLGQQSLNSPRISDPTPQTMSRPWGLAYFGWGGLAVSDIAHNRVLIFNANNGNFENFQTARAVFGQAGFFTSGEGGAGNRMRAPRGMDVDGNDRLYVADTNNNRVLVFGNTATAGNEPNGTTVTPGVSAPEDVAVSSAGILWVASTGNSQVHRYAIFNELGVLTAPTASISSFFPLAIALDAFDNLIVADSANRVTFYYSQIAYRHAAAYTSSSRPQASFAPNTYVVGFGLGKTFDLPDTEVPPPYPKELAGVQILVDGVPAPIAKIIGGSIYYIVPNDAATSGEIELLVVRPSTGEILGAGLAIGGPYAPGFFTASANGQGPIAAINEDGTVNSPANPAERGKILTLYLTGYGRLPGLVDGEAPGRAIATPEALQVYAGGSTVISSANILYSGVSPQFPGLWQINIRLPAVAEPGNATPINGRAIIYVQYGESYSNVGPVCTPNGCPIDQDQLIQDGRITQYYLKP